MSACPKGIVSIYASLLSAGQELVGRAAAIGRIRRLVRAERLSVVADATQVSQARAWARGQLPTEHPCLDSTMTVLSELVTNAIVHGSRPGGRVQITLRRWPGRRISLSVADWGSGIGSRPTMRAFKPASESGRGLLIVGALVTRLKVRGNRDGHRVSVLLRPQKPGSADAPPAELSPDIASFECDWDQPAHGTADVTLRHPHA